MKTLPAILMIVLLTNLSSPCYAEEAKVLKYHSKQVQHQINVSDGKVVGGKSRGGFVWKVNGGAYDGKYLHVTFSSPQRSGCKSWFTQVYEVNDIGPRMIINIDKCGHYLTNINEQFYWDKGTRG
jgi:hypothetical protein